MSAQKKIVLNADEVERLLGNDTNRALDQIVELKDVLARKHVGILRSPANVMLYGLDERTAKSVLQKINVADFANINRDISMDISRGLVQAKGQQYFWSIDFLDSGTLKARLESDLYAVSIMEIGHLARKAR